MSIQSINIATHIVKTPGVVGGRPHITGTRVSVQRVAAWYKMGLNAEEICDRIGTITLAQVYAALTYYHSNRDEIEAYLREERETYNQLSQQSANLP